MAALGGDFLPWDSAEVLTSSLLHADAPPSSHAVPAVATATQLNPVRPLPTLTETAPSRFTLRPTLPFPPPLTRPTNVYKTEPTARRSPYTTRRRAAPTLYAVSAYAPKACSAEVHLTANHRLHLQLLLVN